MQQQYKCDFTWGDDCRDAAFKAIDLGGDPAVAIMKGLVKWMEKAGILYDSREYFMLAVLMSAEAL